MKKKLIVFMLFLSLFVLPAFASAQVQVRQVTSSSACANQVGGQGIGATLAPVLCTIGNILNILVPILISLGVVYFIWGVITYVIASDEEAKKTGRNRIIYGIIGLAVIVSVWGLVRVLTQTFNVDNENQTITLPNI